MNKLGKADEFTKKNRITSNKTNYDPLKLEDLKVVSEPSFIGKEDFGSRAGSDNKNVYNLVIKNEKGESLD